MIDVSQFSGDIVLQSAMTQVNTLLSKGEAFVKSPLPSATYSHVKAHMEQADGLVAEIVQLNAELAMGMHLTNQQLQQKLKDRTEEAWDDYGKNRFFAENTVNGDTEITDLKLKASCMRSAIDALESIKWVITKNKEHVCHLFEKTK